MVESNSDLNTNIDALSIKLDRVEGKLDQVLAKIDALTMQDNSHIINNIDYWNVFYNCSWKQLLHVLNAAFLRYYDTSSSNFTKIAEMRVKMSKLSFPSTT